MLASAVLTADDIVLSTCCEPAAGVRWSVTTESELGYGTTTDANDDTLVTVDPNGGFVRVDHADGSTTDLMSSDARTPTDAAITPGGRIAVVSFSDSDEYTVHLAAPSAATFDSSEPVYGASLPLSSPGVDALGRIWIIESEQDSATPGGEVFAIDSGGSQPIDTPLGAVDLAIDSSGAYLALAIGGGRVLTTRVDEVAFSDTGITDADRVDW